MTYPNEPEAAAVRHILTSPTIASRCTPYLAGDSIDWAGLFAESESMSGGERLLVSAASDLATREGYRRPLGAVGAPRPPDLRPRPRGARARPRRPGHPAARACLPRGVKPRRVPPPRSRGGTRHPASRRVKVAAIGWGTRPRGTLVDERCFALVWPHVRRQPSPRQRAPARRSARACLVEQEGQDLLDDEERIRALARDARAGGSRERARQAVAALGPERQARRPARVRALLPARQHRRAAPPDPPPARVRGRGTGPARVARRRVRAARRSGRRRGGSRRPARGSGRARPHRPPDRGHAPHGPRGTPPVAALLARLDDEGAPPSPNDVGWRRRSRRRSRSSGRPTRSAPSGRGSLTRSGKGSGSSSRASGTRSRSSSAPLASGCRAPTRPCGSGAGSAVTSTATRTSAPRRSRTRSSARGTRRELYRERAAGARRGVGDVDDGDRRACPSSATPMSRSGRARRGSGSGSGPTRTRTAARSSAISTRSTRCSVRTGATGSPTAASRTCGRGTHVRPAPREARPSRPCFGVPGSGRPPA